jgi:hypothetical protein
VAPLKHHVLLRAQRIKDESHLLRVEAERARAAARDNCGLCHALTREVARQLERREDMSRALGTWPYWAPATHDLFSVLVVADAVPA